MPELPTHTTMQSLLAAIETSERLDRALVTTIHGRLAIVLPGSTVDHDRAVRLIERVASAVGEILDDE